MPRRSAARTGGRTTKIHLLSDSMADLTFSS